MWKAYLKSNRQELRILVQPDYDNHIMIVQIGDFNMLRHKPTKPTCPRPAISAW